MYLNESEVNIYYNYRLTSVCLSPVENLPHARQCQSQISTEDIHRHHLEAVIMKSLFMLCVVPHPACTTCAPAQVEETYLWKLCKTSLQITTKLTVIGAVELEQRRHVANPRTPVYWST